jgi:hypothetical protein
MVDERVACFVDVWRDMEACGCRASLETRCGVKMVPVGYLLLRLHEDVSAGDGLHQLVQLVRVRDALALSRMLRRVCRSGPRTHAREAYTSTCQQSAHPTGPHRHNKRGDVGVYRG